MTEEQTIETPAAQDTGEIDVDALLAEIGDKSGEAAVEPTPAAEQVWNGQEWEFDWNGKKIVPENRDKLKTWASQGYNYSQRMGELNKTHAQRMAEAEARERAAQDVEKRYSPYAEVDKYAQDNKEWWQHVQESFKSRATHGVDPVIAQHLNPLREELGEIKQFMTAHQEAQAKAALEAEQAQQDEALDAEIDTIRKQFPNIDLSVRDESGETLERRIYAHANKIGTHSFGAAFKDLLFDQLVVQQQAQTKLQAVKGTQAQAKAGLLGKTPAPTKELRPIDPKRSWSDDQFSVQTILKEINGG